MMRKPTIFAAAAVLLATGAMAQDDPRAPAVLAEVARTLGPQGLSADARYGIAFSDLNDDHQPEAILHLSDRGYCGSGGCTTFVLAGVEGVWHVIGRMTVTRLPIYRLPTHRNGWFDLAVRVGGGGVQPGMRTVRFDRGRYASNPTKASALARLPQEASLLLGADSVEFPVGQ